MTGGRGPPGWCSSRSWELGREGGSSQGWTGNPCLTFGPCSYPVIPDSRPFPAALEGRRVGGCKWCPTSYSSRLARPTQSRPPHSAVGGRRTSSTFVNGGHIGRANSWLQSRALELSSGCAAYHCVSSGKLLLLEPQFSPISASSRSLPRGRRGRRGGGGTLQSTVPTTAFGNTTEKNTVEELQLQKGFW